MHNIISNNLHVVNHMPNREDEEQRAQKKLREI